MPSRFIKYHPAPSLIDPEWGWRKNKKRRKPRPVEKHPHRYQTLAYVRPYVVRFELVCEACGKQETHDVDELIGQCVERVGEMYRACVCCDQEMIGNAVARAR